MASVVEARAVAADEAPAATSTVDSATIVATAFPRAVRVSHECLICIYPRILSLHRQHVKRLAVEGAKPARVENCGDLGVGGIVEPAVNLVDHGLIGAPEEGGRQRQRDAQGLGCLTLEADAEVDEVLLRDGHILTQLAYHAFAFRVRCAWVAPQLWEVLVPGPAPRPVPGHGANC